MVNKLKMTVLIDNIAPEGLICEWGLSILIEADWEPEIKHFPAIEEDEA